MQGEAAQPAKPDRATIVTTRPGISSKSLRRWIPLAATFLVLSVVIGTRETRSTAPAPHISALVPSHAEEGSDDLVVSVTGEHFQPGASVVLWNGSARPTQTFQGTTTLLAATIFNGDLLVPGPATVTVTVVDADVPRSSAPVTFHVVPLASRAGTGHQRTARDRVSGATRSR